VEIKNILTVKNITVNSVKLKDLLVENVSDIMKSIKDFVAQNSYFDAENEEKYTVSFSTRKNGSVSSETASPTDIKAGQVLKNEIQKKFKGVSVKLEVVDEWVTLTADLSKSEIELVTKSRMDVSKYHRIMKQIEEYAKQHILTNMPHLATHYATGEPVDKNRYIGKVENKGKTHYDYDLDWLKSWTYTHTIKIEWIDTDVPVPKRKKAFDKYMKKLKGDIAREFKLSKYINPKHNFNNTFDVTYIGGDGIWMQLYIHSPSLNP
jgi:hypothetical protein